MKFKVEHLTKSFGEKRVLNDINFTFEQGKIYGTLCYLVVCYDGKQKAYRFTHEENLNALLDGIREKTTIPVGKP